MSQSTTGRCRQGLSGWSVIAIISAVAALLVLAGCKSVTSTGSARVDSSQRWAMLPFNNYSSTPLAGEKAGTLLETHLRSRGVTQLDSYQNPDKLTLAALLNDKAQFEKAVEWARGNGFRYGVTGDIHEWHYKAGPDKEPAVGLSLKVLDLTTGQVVWQASGARTGWGYSNLTRIADKVINDLIKKVRIASFSRSSAATLAQIVPTGEIDRSGDILKQGFQPVNGITPNAFHGSDKLLPR